MNKTLYNKKAVVFGGSGFLGSHVADNLTKKGYRVILFDKHKSRWLKKNQKMMIGDIQNISSLKKAIKGAEVVYNFAAIANIGEALESPIKTVKTNILGTVNILEICKKYKIKRFIFASSIYVHSRQGGFYRTSKQASELYIDEYYKRYGLNYTVLRFGTVYGPRADIRNNLSRIVSNALRTRTIKYSGTSKAVRQFIHVKDAAKASINILNKKFINKNILVTGKKNSKVKDLLYLISDLLKISKKPKFAKKNQFGHYDTSPYSYKPKSDKKYFVKHQIKIKEGIKELINEIKNKKK